jgi:hypothetical protein
VVISGCGSADGPSLWSSGIAVSGDTGGGSTTGDGTECGAFAACCTELEDHPSSDGASCNGSSIPSDETACAIGLAAFQETGSCTDIPNPDATSGTIDAGTTGDGGGTKGTPDAAPAPVASYGCNQPQNSQCHIIRTNGDAADACRLEMGTSSGTTCPTTDLLGCCVPPPSSNGVTTEDCYYSGGTTSYSTAQVMSGCASDGKTFSSQP